MDIKKYARRLTGPIGLIALVALVAASRLESPVERLARNVLDGGPTATEVESVLRGLASGELHGDDVFKVDPVTRARGERLLGLREVLRKATAVTRKFEAQRKTTLRMARMRQISSADRDEQIAQIDQAEKQLAEQFGRLFKSSPSTAEPQPQLTLFEQFRQRYPQYANVDDNTLARALRKKYYPDLPVEKYRRWIGLPPLKTGPDPQR